MVTLYKTELGITIDLEGVIEFKVEIPERSKQFAVVAVFPTREQVIFNDSDWDRAHLLRTWLTHYTIDNLVNIKTNEDTGSIVPA